MDRSRSVWISKLNFMATKLIIVFPILDSNRMPPMGRFRRSIKHDAHIWDEREYDTSVEEDMKAFNQTILSALTQYPEHPTKAVVKAIYEAPLEIPILDFKEEEPSEPRKRHARMKPGLA